MSINQNNSSEFKNIFVLKEQTHNFIVLFLAILSLFLASFFLYEDLIHNAFLEIIFVVFIFIFGFFKIITSSLLIIKLKKIKNEIEPKKLNFYIYQSSWMRKKIATFWTTLSYLTIFLFIFCIYLIINLINHNFSAFALISYGIFILGILFIGTSNYKIINNNLIKGKRYISAKKIESFDNIFQEKKINSFFKKIYIYLLFCLFLIPWFFMINNNFRMKINIIINK